MSVCGSMYAFMDLCVYWSHENMKNFHATLCCCLESKGGSVYSTFYFHDFCLLDWMVKCRLVILCLIFFPPLFPLNFSIVVVVVDFFIVLMFTYYTRFAYTLRSVTHTKSSSSFASAWWRHILDYWFPLGLPTKSYQCQQLVTL